MTPQELKEKSYKTVKTPISDTDFQIRRLTYIEVSEARYNGVLGERPEEPVKEEPKYDSFQMAAKAAAMGERMEAESIKHVLTHGVVGPKIVFAEEAGQEVPEGAVDARWIAEDLRWLVNQVLTFSGLNEIDNKKVEDFTKNEAASAS